jgi:alpha-glucoside transport system permease protein
VIAKILLAAIALAVGVGGIWLLFIGVGALVSLLQPKWRDRILPWVFVGPALALLAVFLVYPAAGTDPCAFQDNEASSRSRIAVMIEPEFTQILRNNVIWLIVGTGGSVVLGLVFAGLFDRVDARRWPRPSCSCRWRSRSSALGHLGLRLRLAAPAGRRSDS